MPALILQGDALHVPLPDDSVDLIATSPPYWALRSYRDGEEHFAGQLGSEPDPFAFLDALLCATATTAGVASVLGRIGISLDLSLDYCRLARWRVERSGHFAKTIERTNRENQGSLL